MSALQAGLNVTAIGLGVVFVLLTLLVGIIQAMSRVSHLIEGTQPARADPRADSAHAASAAELVSVISAAITQHRKQR